VDMNTLLSQTFVAYKVSRTFGSIGYLYFGQADLSTFTPASGTTDYCAKFVEKALLPLHKGRCYSLAVGVSAQVSLLASSMLGAKASLFSAPISIVSARPFGR